MANEVQEIIVAVVPNSIDLAPLANQNELVNGQSFICSEHTIGRYQVWDALSAPNTVVQPKAQKLPIQVPGGFSSFIMGYPAKVQGSNNTVDSVFVTQQTFDLIHKLVLPTLYTPPALLPLVADAIAAPEVHYVPNSSYCATVFAHVSANVIMKNKKYSFSLNQDEPDLSFIMAPFSIFPDFKSTLQDYFRNPDTGVTPETVASTGATPDDQDLFFENKVNEVAIQAQQRIGDYVRNLNNANALFTENEWKVIAYCILICFSKSGEVQNIETALNTRVKSISLAMNMRLKDNFASNMINCSQLNKISSKMTEYPVLKAHLARLLLSDPSPFGKHTRSILEGTSLSMFTLIISFLGTDCPTRLHILRPVIMEIRRFHVIKTELEHKYGEGWKFHKVFFPEDQTAATSKFPALQNAAQVWGSVSGNTANAANIMIRTRVGEAALQRLRALASQPLPNDWIRDSLTRVEFENLVKGCGMKIDVSKITDEQWADILEN